MYQYAEKRMTENKKSPSLVIQRAPGNEWTEELETQIVEDGRRLGLGAETLGEKAFVDKALESDAECYHYGKEPVFDNQVEILGSASFLKIKKDSWKTMVQGGARARSVFQIKMDELTYTDGAGGPWFLNRPERGGYDIHTAENLQFIEQVSEAIRNPDKEDPQQIIGATYNRDVNIEDSNYGKAVSGKEAPALNDIILVHKNLVPDKEYRIQVTAMDLDAGYPIYAGEIVKIPNRTSAQPIGQTVYVINKSGTFELCRGPCRKQPCVYPQGVTGPSYIYDVDNTFDTAINGEDSRIVDRIWYESVILAEDALGFYYQNDNARGRNRGLSPQLNDDMVKSIRERIGDGSSPRDMIRTLGPWHSWLNIQELGWDIAVAPYRRLGGDAIFREADHLARDPGKYSPVIHTDVDVKNPDWYYNEQKDNPIRFVGGRSNSTLGYLKSAAVLYHMGKLSFEECKDIIAFVVADMAVSGEHGMNECMTTVAITAQHVSPWNKIAFGAEVETLTAWLKLVPAACKTSMYKEVCDRISAFKTITKENFDFLLFRILVALGKQLWNHRNDS